MSPMRKLKPIEAGDGSYGGMVLSAFDSLPALTPSGADSNDVVASAEGTVAALAVEPENVCRGDELATQRTGIAKGRQAREHLLAAVHDGIVIDAFGRVRKPLDVKGLENVE